MTDLFAVFSKLVTPQGEILVPGIKELVAPLTDEERARYEAMDFSVSDLEAATSSKTAISEDKAKVLMSRMRYPVGHLNAVGYLILNFRYSESGVVHSWHRRCLQ